MKKPGPVFLEMARAAYAAGADYFYRINDDTELMVNWPAKFVAGMQVSSGWCRCGALFKAFLVCGCRAKCTFCFHPNVLLIMSLTRY